ncbi:MAG: UDP-N-acetylmuramoyl-L-alanyl-D-glutamate--2,6-diaminopimelate ligase [Planctomycetes bacterium]|nr:UDP-N-acetylmuramoyl-L-alanyl-D-glutamate--2,6-diaminopimelate ligase [Planctomycetota bacterium]
MRLSEVLATVREVTVSGSADPDIRGLAVDSREVADGFLFAAVDGARHRGAAYVDDALGRGAAALLLPRRPETDPGVPYVVAGNVRKAVGEAADQFFGQPSRSLDLVGITGTNGKTTTAYLLRHVFQAAGRRTGMLGTIEYDLGSRVEPAPLTTPDAVRFSRSLAAMRDNGCRAAVAEVSSHALAQDRVWPHRFAGAVFTNLSRDHLDYHGDMDSYREAKRLLFSRLDTDAVAIVNRRDAACERLVADCQAAVLGFRLLAADEPAAQPEDDDTVLATVTESGLTGQVFRLSGAGLDAALRTPLIGRHNVENCLAAYLAAVRLGVAPAVAAAALADFPGVPGRLERFASADGVIAFVDYAHTDDALRSVLSVLRPLTDGRLTAVFGCGGDRDPGKRPLMAAAAERYADRIVVTSDNPRGEDPERIIADILPGFTRPDGFAVAVDRRRAVELAIAQSRPGDVVLVAGKGHEDYQIIGTEKRWLDDRHLVREALASRGSTGEREQEPCT